MTEHELKNIQIVNSCLDALLQWDATGVAPCDDVEEYLHHILDNITPVAEQLGLHKEQRDIQNLPVEERHHRWPGHHAGEQNCQQGQV